jgi:hypothetical protein
MMRRRLILQGRKLRRDNADMVALPRFYFVAIMRRALSFRKRPGDSAAALQVPI